jgi:hypothetical protein
MMKTTMINNNPHTKNIVSIVIGTAVILSIPLIAMQFTDEVQWNVFDFIIIGALLLGTGLMYELLATKLTTTTQRGVLAVVLLVVLVLIWAELAVGVFGTSFAGS